MLTDLIGAAALPHGTSAHPGGSSREVHKSKTITLAKLSEGDPGLVSGLGHKRTFRSAIGVFALPPKADIRDAK